MSQLEVGQNKYYSRRVTLVKGVGSIANNFAYPINGSSRVTSITRAVLGGTAGKPYASAVNGGLSTFPIAQANVSAWTLAVLSSDALDTSTYLVTWYNDFNQSPQYAQEIVGASANLQGINVQYAP